MTRRGPCISQDLTCPVNKGNQQFVLPTEVANPYLAKLCNTCPVNCSKCFQPGNIWCEEKYTPNEQPFTPVATNFSDPQCFVNQCEICEKTQCDKCVEGHKIHIRMDTDIIYECLYVADSTSCQAGYGTATWDSLSEEMENFCVKLSDFTELQGFSKSGNTFTQCNDNCKNCHDVPLGNPECNSCDGTESMFNFPPQSTATQGDNCVDLGVDTKCVERDLTGSCVQCQAPDYSVIRISAVENGCSCNFGTFYNDVTQVCEECPMTWCKFLFLDFKFNPFQATFAPNLTKQCPSQPR